MGNHGLFEPRDTLSECPDLNFPVNDDDRHRLSLIRCNNHYNTSQRVVFCFCKKESELSHSSSDYYYCCDTTVMSNLDSDVEMSHRPSKIEGNGCVGEKDHKPESSSESYESMVLRSSETLVVDDEYCTVPSTQSHIESERTSNKKFKRGRRMKDFRKDVLPTLASLSEREIWEDLRFIELSVRANSRINKSGLIVSSRSRNRGRVGRR